MFAYNIQESAFEVLTSEMHQNRGLWSKGCWDVLAMYSTPPIPLIKTFKGFNGKQFRITTVPVSDSILLLPF